MPDQMPEHHEHPPQWPPPSWHNEPTSRPQAAEEETVPAQEPAPAFASSDPMPAQPAAGPGGSQQPPTASSPSAPGSTDQPATPARPSLAEAAVPAEKPAEPPKSRIPATAPPTHHRAVRMAIYGMGGLVVVGLLVAIIVMAGGTIVPNLGGDDDEEPADTGYALVDGDGKIDPKVYAELAAAIGTEDWIDWRNGPAAEGDSKSPTAEEPKSTKLKTGDGIDHTYQYGDDSATNPMYNVQGQLGFVSDDAAQPGVDRVTAMETTNSSLGFAPRPGGRLSTDAAEVELTEGTTAKCIKGSKLGPLVAMDRADGAGMAAHSVLAFSSGAIATTGISGAQGGTCVQLPKGQVPTSVVVTPANEFALVTVWDTKEVRGRVAVIALGDKAGTYASSWPQTYPGLPSPGHFSFAKLLGFVELGSKAPTSIAVGTDYAGKNVDRSQADLSNPDIRAAYANDVATTGFAAVTSQAEKTVEWIDLKPLLSGISKAYFTGDPGVYAQPGTDGKAWPPDFASQADYMPKVAGSTELEAEPGSVVATADKAYVSDASGKLASFNVSAAKSATPAGTIDLPGASSCLAATADGKQLLATSRGDRSISWINPGKNGASVIRTLRDSRITDPICAQDIPQSADSGTKAQAVAVADFGSGSLLTFRYGKGTIAASNKDVSLADDAFEFGGAYQPKGKPFAISTTPDNI